jgi:hypothetical protein
MFDSAVGEEGELSYRSIVGYQESLGGGYLTFGALAVVVLD